jgi:hypothetical protein
MNYEHKYDAAHKWLRYHIGPAKICTSVKCTGRSKKYQWALRHGMEHAKDPRHYRQLCVSCHAIYDGKMLVLAEKKQKRVIGVKSGITIDVLSIKEAARIAHTSKTAISNNLHGRSKSAAGFIWSIA